MFLDLPKYADYSGTGSVSRFLFGAGQQRGAVSRPHRGAGDVGRGGCCCGRAWRGDTETWSSSSMVDPDCLSGARSEPCKVRMRGRAASAANRWSGCPSRPSVSLFNLPAPPATDTARVCRWAGTAGPVEVVHARCCSGWGYIEGDARCGPDRWCGRENLETVLHLESNDEPDPALAQTRIAGARSRCGDRRPLGYWKRVILVWRTRASMLPCHGHWGHVKNLQAQDRCAARDLVGPNSAAPHGSCAGLVRATAADPSPPS